VQVRALSLIKKHGSLEAVLESLDPKKYQIPDPYPYQEARRLFKGGPPRGGKAAAVSSVADRARQTAQAWLRFCCWKTAQGTPAILLHGDA
jgi:hypothetical protein